MKIVAYNICVGGGANGERLPLIADVLRQEKPDVVALTEATPHSLSYLAGALGMESALAASNHAFPRSLDLHVAWMSRLGIDAVATHAIPALSKALLEIEVAGVRLFVTHLASRHEEQEHPRSVELAAIRDVLAERSLPHLLAGDLNALVLTDPIGAPPPGVVPRRGRGPRPRVIEQLTGLGYVDCYRALHAAPGYTYSSDWPWLRIDYILASPTLAPRLMSAAVASTDPAPGASDHLPIWAEFR